MTKRLSTYLIARWWKFGWVRTSWYVLLHDLSISVTAKFESVGEIWLPIPAPLIWRHTTPSAVKKWIRCTRGSTPCLKTEKLKYWKTEKFANPLETGVGPTHKGLSPLVFVGHNALWISDKAKPFCTYNRDSACNELAWQDGNEYLRIKWARLFSPLKRKSEGSGWNIVPNLANVW